PFRILSTYVAARWYMKFRSGPYVRRPPLSAQLAKPEIVGKRFFTVNSTTRLRSAEETAGPIRSMRPLARSLVADRNASAKSSGPRNTSGIIFTPSPRAVGSVSFKKISVAGPVGPRMATRLRSHNDLLEQLQLLSAQLFGEACQTCDVSIGSGDTRN